MSEDRGWVGVGERLRQARVGAGLSQAELGHRTGLDRTMIAKIEVGSRRVDALELSRLSDVLDVPMEQLLIDQPAVISRRAAVLAEDADTDAARETYRLGVVLSAWLADIRQMVGWGLLEPPRQLRTRMTVTSPEQARTVANWVREQVGLHLHQPVESLMALCQEAGQLVLVTGLPGDGASTVDGDVAAAVISLRGDPGRRRATAAHELGHLILGDEYSSDLGVHASREDRESVIDAFAAELLLPVGAVRAEVERTGPVTRDTMVRLAATFRTSWSLTLRQAVHSNVIGVPQRQAWNRTTPTRAELLEAVGWAPQTDLESIRVPPIYARAVMAAWRAGMVTSSRAVELMHGQVRLDDLPDRAGDLAP